MQSIDAGLNVIDFLFEFLDSIVEFIQDNSIFLTGLITTIIIAFGIVLSNLFLHIGFSGADITDGLLQFAFITPQFILKRIDFLIIFLLSFPGLLIPFGIILCLFQFFKFLCGIRIFYPCGNLYDFCSVRVYKLPGLVMTGLIYVLL